MEGMNSTPDNNKSTSSLLLYIEFNNKLSPGHQ
jgi:hypothetical protein